LDQVSDVENIVMVGDTAFDVIGAAEHKIPCIGVSWGYGLVEDMLNAGAIGIAHTAEELAEMIIT
jgi:phosphoglycolate phosphatase